MQFLSRCKAGKNKVKPLKDQYLNKSHTRQGKRVASEFFCAQKSCVQDERNEANDAGHPTSDQIEEAMSKQHDVVVMELAN